MNSAIEFNCQLELTSLVFNRRELDSLLLLPSYADAHTQHNKKVDRHQSGKMN